MLKKINAAQLRIGMYIDELKCSWLKHPFALNSFKLEKNEDIRRINEVGIKDIIIDTVKGLDILPDKKKVKPLVATRPVACSEEKKEKKTSAMEELANAKIALAEASEVITETMANVKMGLHIELEKINPLINKMTDSILRNPNALLGLSRIRVMDKYTFEHSVSFSILMMAFAKSMGLSKEIIKEVGVGGLLHDIGKTLTPNKILNKPGKLTEEEFIVMKKHVVDSRLILEKTKGISQIAMEIAAQHHEKYDGSGYPLGLKSDQISIYGQMAAVVDVYDALTTDRCYHTGKEPSEVLKLLLKWSGHHFNLNIVKQFIQSVGIYPVGSLVLLTNHHLAKVVDIQHNMLRPQVEMFLDTKKRSYIPRKIINLSDGKDINIASVESYAKWKVTP